MTDGKKVFHARGFKKDLLCCECVIGPIADGKQIKTLITDYRSGSIGKDTLMEKIAKRKIGLQYVFKTAKAISRLVLEDKEVLY